MMLAALVVFLLAGVSSGQENRGLMPDGRTFQSCGTRNRCVPPNFCSSSRVSLNQRETSICDVRQVCCPIANIITPSPPTGSRTPSLRTKMDNGLKCGRRNVDGLMRNTATNMGPSEANEAEFGEFPWIIAILEVKHDNGIRIILFHCGGSLIHPRVVLTAAHYMDGKTTEGFIARAGEWVPHSTAEPFTHQDRKVNEINIHPRFGKAHLTFDAALMILESSFVISPHISPVCLPNAEILQNSATCFVAGWGVEAFESKRNPKKLKKIDLPVLSTEQCNDLLRRTSLGVHFSMHSSFICAGGEAGKDACTGDGGSALMCPIPDNEEYYYQAGIVSWGIGCGQADVPGVYANVLRFRLWIDRVLKEKNLIE